MSYSQVQHQRPAREPSFPRRPSVYDIPGRGMRGYGAYGQVTDPGSVFTASDTVTDPGIAAAAAAATADACAQVGGTLDSNGNCVQASPPPVSGGGGGGAISTLAQNAPASPVKASLASTLTSGPMPWVIGGLLLVGVLAIAAKKHKGADAR